MSKQYALKPRTYRTAMRIYDEFLEYCKWAQVKPSLMRYSTYLLDKEEGKL